MSSNCHYHKSTNITLSPTSPYRTFHWKKSLFETRYDNKASEKNSLEEIPKQRLDTNLPSINDDPSDELGEVDEILNGDNEGIVRNRTSVASFAQNNRLALTL